jgi:hypothetical protein
MRHPTLALTETPEIIIPFPLAENQAAMVTRDVLPQTQARWKNGDLLLSVIETLVRGLMPCNYRSIWST